MFGADFSIMLYARDVRRSIAFYHQGLGFGFKGWWSEERQGYVEDWEQAGSPTYVELEAGPLHLALHGSDEEVAGGGCIFHLQVEDVDAFHSRLRDKGVQVSEPKDEPWGWRMVMVEDPDGHEWGFYTPLR